LSAANWAGSGAGAGETSDVHRQLKENIEEQLGGIDTSLFDKFIYSLDDESGDIFGAGTFKEKIEKLLSGEINDMGGVLQAMLEIVFSQALKILPLIASVVALAVLGGLLAAVKSEKTKTGGVIHFVCYIAIVLIVLNLIYRLVSSVVNAMRLITEFMSLIFPLILTLMTASGSAMSSGIYQPAVALLCGLVSGIIMGVIIPIFIASIVFNVVSNLTDNINVGKFADFFKSAGKWIIGVTFTVFMAFLSIQGILASTYDSVSIRTIKYAIGNSIPFVGGYIKEGFDLVTGSAVLIKNAVGVAGLIMLFCFVLAPVISLIVCSLGLKLTAAVCQPVSDPKVPKFLQATSSSFDMLIAAFAASAFMFFITLMLLLMTSNAVLA
jgi:stage III sporulation protein AE